MIRLPPESTLSATLVPYTTLVRSRAQEVGVQRMHHALLDGALAGDQRLADNLAAIDAAPAEIARQAAEQVVVDDFEVEQVDRSEEHTSELQSLMRISYAVFCLNKKTEQMMIR